MKRSVWSRYWGWPTIVRQAPETLVCWAIGAAVGLFAAGTAPWWQAAILGALAACVWALAWRTLRLAAFLWRHSHWYGWPHEFPACVESAFMLGVAAYCAVALIIGGASPWGSAALGVVWGALAVLLVCGHARRVRQRAWRQARQRRWATRRKGRRPNPTIW